MTDAEYWNSRWQRGEIGFHRATPHPLMKRHLAALGVSPGARLFLPLCGKSLDIGYLLSEGYRIVGSELSRLAVEQLFEESGLTPATESVGPLERFDAEGLTVFVGDFFDLHRETLGEVDAVYDRAALIALPAPLRARYAAHLAAVTRHARQLVVTLDFDDSATSPGPPFSVDGHEVRRLYGGAFHVKELETHTAEGEVKGGSAKESAWLLTAR